jgi:molybdate transport system permease protein
MVMLPFAKKSWLFVLTLVILGVAGGFALQFSPVSRQDTAVKLTVFAGKGTIDVMEEIAKAYQLTHPVSIRFNFASSGTLARQMTAGARPDLYISADGQWMDYAAEHGLIVSESRRDLLGNRLVLIAPAGKAPRVRMERSFNLAGALKGRLAIGDPEVVPAGRYAREALAALHWEDGLRLLPCMDVRAVLAAVERGEVAAGIVFASDTAMTDKVKVIGEFPEHTHRPIRFPAALGRHAAPEAARLLEYLSGPEARDIYIRYGFTQLNQREQGPIKRSATQETETGSPHGIGAKEWAALRLSAIVALWCALAVAVPGTLCAWLLARRQFAGKSLLDILLHLPLVLPPVAVGYLLLSLFGSHGPFGWLNIVFTWKAAVLASAVVAFPLMLRSARTSIELVDRRLEEAARALGATPLRTVLTVTLPLALPGIFAGMVLAFARSLGEFGATIIVAGNILGETQTLPLALFSLLQQSDEEGGARRLVVISILLSYGALALSEVVARRLRRMVGVER